MSEAGSGWSDERVELLKKLWSEGLSASQIATAMGGVTRNAVIGKVHRLGLSGRAKSPSGGAQKPRKSVSVATPRGVATNARASASIPLVQGNTALAAVAVAAERPVETPAPAAVAAVATSPAIAAPESQRVTIMELRENMCRWPMGDPTTADFCFCGNRTTPGIPYCTFHSRIAYQPPERRRDRRSN